MITRNRVPLPDRILKNQRCILCHTYGCVPYLLTSLEDQGSPTGDNLLPLCAHHASFHILVLYPKHPEIRKWLEEHERLDLILSYDQGTIWNYK